jgi:hypothetical protein
MRIAYLTTDEVNKDLALRLAAQWHMTVCPLEPRDPPLDGEFDAVLCDWDHWPTDQRPKTLNGASATSVRRPVAVHSYGVEKHQARALRRMGILFFDRLGPRTLLELQRAVNQARALRQQEKTTDLGQPDDTSFPSVVAERYPHITAAKAAVTQPAAFACARLPARPVPYSAGAAPTAPAGPEPFRGLPEALARVCASANAFHRWGLDFANRDRL